MITAVIWGLWLPQLHDMYPDKDVYLTERAVWGTVGTDRDFHSTSKLGKKLQFLGFSSFFLTAT